jgi:hypothetical protein
MGVRAEMHHRGPAALGGQPFLPPHIRADRARVGDQPLPPATSAAVMGDGQLP